MNVELPWCTLHCLNKSFVRLRYAIYDIRWDQLAVGGWADQTALLVLSGPIPDDSHLPVLLQFLGDGGRMLAWNCESPPFGPPLNGTTAGPIENRTKEQKEETARKCVVSYGSSQTSSVMVSQSVWPAGKDGASLPDKFPHILETSDSEGYSRPLKASVFAKINGSNDTAIIVFDGGSLGGKAVLSRVQKIHYFAVKQTSKFCRLDSRNSCLSVGLF